MQRYLRSATGIQKVMGRVGLLKIVALLATCATVAVLCLSVVGSAGAATVRVGKLILHADGGFAPRQLPRHQYAPIHFKGYADVDTTDGSPPPPLQRIRLDFDRDGKLTTAGLPTCQPDQLQGATPQQARNRCAGALVGTGRVKATVGVPGLRVNVSAPLSLFNGPRQGGNRTVLAHSQTLFPLPETYVVTIPIERRRRGTYGYRSTFDLPPIAGGLGALTHIDAKIGRRYRAGGAERSYVSARCSDGILQTMGLAHFADGTVVSGSLFKGCQALP